jgi:hypothetical protein
VAVHRVSPGAVGQYLRVRAGVCAIWQDGGLSDRSEPQIIATESQPRQVEIEDFSIKNVPEPSISRLRKGE